VEQEPTEIYAGVLECLRELIDRHGLSASNIKSIGVTNQRETTIPFDSHTGQALERSLVWLDTRTKDIVKQI